MTQNEKITPQPKKRKISARGRLPNGAPNPVDVHVGSRIRARRTLLAITQERLGSLMGLTFQQIQKYERGMNRISASRLWDISRILEVPVDFFYQDMNKETAKQSPRMFCTPKGNPEILPEVQETTVDPMTTSESIALVKAYYKISNRKAAKQMLELMQAIAKLTSRESED